MPFLYVHYLSPQLSNGLNVTLFMITRGSHRDYLEIDYAVIEVGRGEYMYCRCATIIYSSPIASLSTFVELSRY